MKSKKWLQIVFKTNSYLKFINYCFIHDLINFVNVTKDIVEGYGYILDILPVNLDDKQLHQAISQHFGEIQ